MVPPKIICPICGKKMMPGKRVQLTFGWEDGEVVNKILKSTIICRKCATKVSTIARLERPENV